MDFNFNTPCTISATGSREICTPPPTDTDQDYLIYVAPDDIDKLLAEVDALGFTRESEFYIGTEFLSYRKEDINLIVTDSKQFHQKFKLATYLAKRFNLLEKTDRISLFTAVLYNIY